MFKFKSKKLKFSVDFCLEELSSVPFINGLLFAKLRLLDERSFNQVSQKEEVKDHCVRWDAKFQFNCKMSVNSSNGALKSKYLRVSIRKEMKGSRSYQKLGFVDVDLADFADSGLTIKRYLLEGYDKNHRQDNATLKVSIEMSLLTEDPLFKRQSRSSSSFYTSLMPVTTSGEERISFNSVTNATKIDADSTSTMSCKELHSSLSSKGSEDQQVGGGATEKDEGRQLESKEETSASVDEISTGLISNHSHSRNSSIDASFMPVIMSGEERLESNGITHDTKNDSTEALHSSLSSGGSGDQQLGGLPDVVNKADEGRQLGSKEESSTSADEIYTGLINNNNHSRNSSTSNEQVSSKHSVGFFRCFTFCNL